MTPTGARRRDAEALRLIAYTDTQSLGGAEACLGHLLAELDPSIEVVLVSVDEHVAASISARRPGTAVRIVPPVRHKAQVGAIAAQARAIRGVSGDILHVNLQTPFAGQYGILGGLLSRTPVVAVEHIVFGSPTRFQRRLRHALCARLAAHVAVGEGAARGIERIIELPAGSIEVVHNGVPDLPIRPIERPRAGPIIGAIGRLVPQKGFDLLIRALTLLPDTTAMIVGDGEERQALEALARELGVEERLLITGWVENARDHMAAADLVAAPSRFEGFPLAVIEAMLASRAVVATSVNSIPEAIEDGWNGLLVPPDQPDRLAAAIDSLLGDPSRRSEMGARGREKALKHFTSASMARSYEAVYRRVLEERA